MDGLNYIPDRETMDLFKIAAKITQDYYPEILGRMYVINANFLFRTGWAICKGFLDEKTRAKINIIGDQYVDTLLEVIEKDNLPKIFGGNCTCEDSTGDCLTSNCGPWNDFEMIKPKGVRRKQQTNRLIQEEYKKTE